MIGHRVVVHRQGMWSRWGCKLGTYLVMKLCLLFLCLAIEWQFVICVLLALRIGNTIQHFGIYFVHIYPVVSDSQMRNDTVGIEAMNLINGASTRCL